MKQTEIILSAQQIKAEALRLGFSACGIAPAEPVNEEHRNYFRNWIARKKQAEMQYLENHLEKRLDPRLLVEGTRSIVCVALNYFPAEQLEADRGKLSWYAYGKDYHEVMKEKLKALHQALLQPFEEVLPQMKAQLCPQMTDQTNPLSGFHSTPQTSLQTNPQMDSQTSLQMNSQTNPQMNAQTSSQMNSQTGPQINQRTSPPTAQNMKTHQNELFTGRAFCDTAPVLERYWAWRCGLGWIGKNHQLIIPRAGSSFFLGELFLPFRTDVYDKPLERSCGACRRCIEACPTQALSEEDFDAGRCLSYLTIENRDSIPEWAADKMYPCFYGCDRCQEVCPHTRFSQPTQEEAFSLNPLIKEMTLSDWEQLTREQYQQLFKGSAVKRAKYEGLKRNIEAMLRSQKTNSPDKL